MLELIIIRQIHCQTVQLGRTVRVEGWGVLCIGDAESTVNTKRKKQLPFHESLHERAADSIACTVDV